MAFKKSIDATVGEMKLNQLRELFPYIHVDTNTLQRLLDEWPDKVKAEHMRAIFEGHSNIYTIVLISIDGCLNYCNSIINEYDEEDTEYTAVAETIDYLSGLKTTGKRFLNIDGQHRVKTYEDFLNDKFTLEAEIFDYIETADEAPIAFQLKGVKFNDMPEKTRQTILDTPLTLVMINKATLQDMVDVTIYTNIGEPWNNHERRIIIPSKFNRFLMSYMNDNPLLEAMFDNTKNLSAKYSIVKKGDSLMVAEWVGYHYNSLRGEIYNWPDETQLDKQSSVIGLESHSTSKLKKSTSIISKLVEIINTTKSVKFERTLLDNLFILLTILDSASHPLNSFKKKVKISSLFKFVDWFLKMESTLRERDFYMKDNDGNVYIDAFGNKSTNSESFKRKCAAKGIGDIEKRSTLMIQEFNNDYNKLFASGIISLIDTKTYSKQDKLEAAIRSEFKDASGKEFTFEELMGSDSIIEGDHQNAVSKGNDTSKENLTLRTKRANIRKSNKQMIN